MTDIESRIRSVVEAFAADLARLVREAALAAVETHLGVQARTAATQTARNATAPAARRRASSGTRPARSGSADSKQSAGPVRTPGEKRDPKELAKLIERLAGYIKANPGQRIEHINRALGVPTKELTLPIRKLLHAKRIKAQGQRRATSYVPV